MGHEEEEMVHLLTISRERQEAERLQSSPSIVQRSREIE
jgi:hypothetical protein